LLTKHINGRINFFIFYQVLWDIKSIILSCASLSNIILSLFYFFYLVSYISLWLLYLKIITKHYHIAYLVTISHRSFSSQALFWLVSLTVVKSTWLGFYPLPSLLVSGTLHSKLIGISLILEFIISHSNAKLVSYISTIVRVLIPEWSNTSMTWILSRSIYELLVLKVFEIWTI
jgi:hypothetical protein